MSLESWYDMDKMKEVDNYTTVKIKHSTLRLLKILAAIMDKPVLQTLDGLVKEKLVSIKSEYKFD